MRRAVVVQTLIAVLLACPYVCMGEETVVGAHSPRETCCGDRQSCPADQNAPPAPEDGEPGCLCQGAMLDGVKIEAPDAIDGWFVPVASCLDGDARLLHASPPSADFARHARHFSPLATGRDIRALTCALLC